MFSCREIGGLRSGQIGRQMSFGIGRKFSGQRKELRAGGTGCFSGVPGSAAALTERIRGIPGAEIPEEGAFYQAESGIEEILIIPGELFANGGIWFSHMVISSKRASRNAHAEEKKTEIPGIMQVTVMAFCRASLKKFEV